MHVILGLTRESFKADYRVWPDNDRVRAKNSTFNQLLHQFNLLGNAFPDKIFKAFRFKNLYHGPKA